MSTASELKDERDLLKDEIAGITAQLLSRHNMSVRGIRTVARRAVQSGKIRPLDEVVKMRISTKEDLLGDLEEAAVELGVSRQVQLAITKGSKLV